MNALLHDFSHPHVAACSLANGFREIWGSLFQIDTSLVSYSWNLPMNLGLIRFTVLSVVLQRFD